MKIRIIELEGEQEAVEGILAKLLSGEAQSTPQIIENVDSSQGDTDSNSEAAIDSNPNDNTEAPTNREIVLDAIRAKPGLTLEQLAAATKLSQTQTKSAVVGLKNKRLITPMVVRGHVTRPIRYKPAMESLPDLTSHSVGVLGKVVEFIRKNPGKTSREIAQSLDVPYGRVTSSMTNLLRSKRAVASGAGGINDPYRYSIA